MYGGLLDVYLHLMKEEGPMALFKGIRQVFSMLVDVFNTFMLQGKCAFIQLIPLPHFHSLLRRPALVRDFPANAACFFEMDIAIEAFAFLD